jgi:Tfp pilus assembly protein PilO
MIKKGPVLVMLAGIGLILLIVVALILPKAAAVKSKQAELVTAQQQESELTLHLAQLKAAAADAPKDRRRMAKLQAQVPPTADLSSLIRLINSSANQANVDFIALAPGTPTVNPNGLVSTIPIQMTVDGRFFAVDQFLFRLENLPRASRIVSITMVPGPDGAPQVSVGVTVEFYTTDISAGPGSIPGPQEGAVAPVAPAVVPPPTSGG